MADSVTGASQNLNPFLPLDWQLASASILGRLQKWTLEKKGSWKIKLTALSAFLCWASWLSWTLLFHTAAPQPKSFKTTHSSSHICKITRDFSWIFYRSWDRWRARMRSVSSVSIGFTWWAHSQPFSRSPPHLKGRESGDVRLILDTKGERVAEQKCCKRLCSLQDWETAEWTPEYRCWRHWVCDHQSFCPFKRTHTHTLSFVILVGKFTDILSHGNLNMNS